MVKTALMALLFCLVTFATQAANEGVANLMPESTVVKPSMDPTAPLNWQAPKAKIKTKRVKRYPLPALQSIMCMDGDRGCYAILNNKVMQAGKTIQGYRVMSINKESVRLTRDNKTWTLKLFSQVVKK